MTAVRLWLLQIRIAWTSLVLDWKGWGTWSCSKICKLSRCSKLLYPFIIQYQKALTHPCIFCCCFSWDREGTTSHALQALPLLQLPPLSQPKGLVKHLFGEEKGSGSGRTWGKYTPQWNIFHTGATCRNEVIRGSISLGSFSYNWELYCILYDPACKKFIIIYLLWNIICLCTIICKCAFQFWFNGKE